MPSGQEEAHQQGVYQNPDHKSSILKAVKEQEAQYQQLSRELDTERQNITAHLERYNIRDPEDGSATYTETSYIWRPTQINSVIPEDSEFDPNMSESHLHYYPDHGPSLPEYLQEGIPEVQESYSMSYETSTSTNGHHGDGDASSNNSSVPIDNASLVSRHTSETKTQSVKTVTKKIVTREIHHMTPEGKPINYSAYGGGAADFNAPYLKGFAKNPANVSHDYGTYDPGRPASPAGEVPNDVRLYEYGSTGTYGVRTGLASPASAARNFEYSDYAGGYRENYAPHSTQSGDSPNLQKHRAMPQAPRATDYNHEPANYEDIDTRGSHTAGLVPPPRMDYRTPSPTESADRYGNYAGEPLSLPAASPGYHQYNGSFPEGYLDERPSYDEPHHFSQARGPNPTYASRPAYSEEPVPLSANELVHPIQRGHQHLDYPVETESGVIRFRDPDLSEVVLFLSHPNSIKVKVNAAAYLTHLAYMDDSIKQKARSLGAIPPLIALLNHDIPEVERNACSALKNLSYGRQNDENKRAIRNSDGIPALVRLLRKSPDMEIRELTTGILWNLSSCEEIKLPIIDEALNTLVNHVIIPNSGYDSRTRNPLEQIKQHENDYSNTVFRNASGVLRNVSSAGAYARKKLRGCDGLIESMVYVLRSAIGTEDVDNKSVENCVCILRNLSYRCEEIVDPEYDKHAFTPATFQTRTAPIRAVENLGCFGTKKKKDSGSSFTAGVPLTKNPINQSDVPSGVNLLWEPEVVEIYLSLLSECSNPESLEGSAGAIMNLSACYWQPSIDIRASVRKDKGLPILVELLRVEHEAVIAVSAKALRNLALDSRNRDLIGSYALKDLLLKLPNGSPEHDTGTSEETIAAVLCTLTEVVSKSSDFARSLLSLGGVERLNQITSKGTYSPRVVKFATQLLYNMYQFVELREAYKKAGWRESHFIGKSAVGKSNSLSSPTGAMSSEGGTKYEDRTLPHGTELNSSASIPYSRSEELPLSELSHASEPAPSQIHRPHMGVFPPGMAQARSPAEPVYAQVKKKDRERRDRTPTTQHSRVTLLDQPDGMPAGDSWV